MKDLDKELEDILDTKVITTNYKSTKERKYFETMIKRELRPILQKAIKSVILEALKAELENEFEYSDDIAIEDCLEVCNKLLGDSNE